MPASTCGLVGLKPSRYRRFEPPGSELNPVRIINYGALSRTVRDSAHFIAAMEALIPSRRLPPIGLIEGPASRRLRVAVFTNSPIRGDVHREVREVTLAAASPAVFLAVLSVGPCGLLLGLVTLSFAGIVIARKRRGG